MILDGEKSPLAINTEKTKIDLKFKKSVILKNKERRIKAALENSISKKEKKKLRKKLRKVRNKMKKYKEELLH